MNVLVACEESQIVCKEFLKFGHNAFSCDLKECSGGRPDRHIIGDCLRLLSDNVSFYTCDEHLHVVDKWDLLIAHPPCTYLAKSGACNNKNDPTRIPKGFLAAQFFYKIYNCNIERVCIENPVPQRIFKLPPYSQTVQPYNFGEPYSKLTLLWLKNLPPLINTTCSLKDESLQWCKLHSSATQRSKTFKGIAEAMANQWGCYESI